MKLNNKKLIFFTKYSFNGASSRYRTFQYIDIFNNEGANCKIYTLFNQNYLDALYNNKRIKKILYASVSILKRILNVIFIPKCDLCIIEKELIPYFPPLLEKFLKIKNIPFILDYDDAIFINYKKNKTINFLLKNKISSIIRMSEGVMAGSPYLFDYCKKYNDNSIFIPTSINFKKYDNITIPSSDKLSIGWIGTPSTSNYIIQILPSLLKIINKYKCDVHLIGFDKNIKNKFLNNKNIKIIKWEYETELIELSKIDIGLMPLLNTDWCKGKCALKIIQYLALGIPVVVSPIGANKNIVNNGKNGFFAIDEKDWFNKISTLIEDKQQRILLGKNGKNQIKDFYDTKINSIKIVNFYKNILSKN